MVLDDGERMACGEVTGTGQLLGPFTVRVESLTDGIESHHVEVPGVHSYDPPVWSLSDDGDAMAWAAPCADDTQGCVDRIRMDGTGPVRVLAGLPHDRRAEIAALVWSHDGQRIAVLRDRVVVVVAADGSSARPITMPAGRPDKKTVGAHGVAWSPDDRKLLIASDLDVGCMSSSGYVAFLDCQTELFVFDLETEHLVRLSRRQELPGPLWWVKATR